MVDLAVPRNVASDVEGLSWVRVRDVDDLQALVAGNTAARAEEARRADGLVAEEVARFSRERALRDAVPVLILLRQRADAIVRAEVDRTLGTLGEALTDKQRRSVETMGRAIINKLLHQPTARLRAEGPGAEASGLAGAAAELFGLAALDGG
jgi:glutamyl-tRNA reductase